MAATSTTPVALSFDAIEDLIYSARAGDIEALKEDVTKLSQENNCFLAAIIESAIDIADEAEGGTGGCLLHWPAANGNIEILGYLLEALRSATTSPLINHKNNAGNTPLHWAALNTHFDCVKALVEAGADVNLKNDAGHDAAFLAERAEWSKDGDDEGEATSSEQAEEAESTGESAPAPPMTEGIKVVEMLLEKAAEIEENAGNASADSGSGGDEMEGVEKTGSS